jgi:hypothetical protein
MKNLAAAVAIMAVLAVTGMAEASLSTIGTADYAGSSYNLIYDKDSSLIWLDYSNANNTWGNQVAWASNLGSTLSNVKLNAGVSVNYNSGWRLPTTVDGTTWGYSGTTAGGYNITSSEFGHLYYTELLNKGQLDTNGTAQAGWGLSNKGPFANLQSNNWYWSGTEFTYNPYRAWTFYTSDGYQYTYFKDYGGLLGMAVRSGQIVEATPTPIPAALPLFASGLACLAGLKLRRRGR